MSTQFAILIGLAVAYLAWQGSLKGLIQKATGTKAPAAKPPAPASSGVPAGALAPDVLAALNSLDAYTLGLFTTKALQREAQGEIAHLMTSDTAAKIKGALMTPFTTPGGAAQPVQAPSAQPLSAPSTAPAGPPPAAPASPPAPASTPPAAPAA